MTGPVLPFSPGEAGAEQTRLAASLRRRSSAATALGPGPAARELVAALERVVVSRKSETLLVWPQRPDSVAVFHALAMLERLEHCDERGLATLFFPWNRNTSGMQRTLLVDREFLDPTVLRTINRLGLNSRSEAMGYVMALHSLSHVLKSGKKSTVLKRALKDDPGLLHPTLLEMAPQGGVHRDGMRGYEEQFLRRLGRHTWLDGRAKYIAAATDPKRTPFFLFGVHPDGARVSSLRTAGLDPRHGGRTPNLILIDATRRARERLDGWRQVLPGFLGVVSDLYGTDSPPVLAITDDCFALEALRWDFIKRYEVRRRVQPEGSQPASAAVILSVSPDPLNQEAIQRAPAVPVRFEVYGSDVLKLVDSGLKLRRAMVIANDRDNADVVTQAIAVAQSLVGLPGSPQQLYEFLTANFEGYERQSVGARFDHQVPAGKMRTVLQQGHAGTNHSGLSKFLNAFDALCRATESTSPSRRLFDECLRRLAQAEGRALVVCSTELLRGFVEWRIETDADLAEIRPLLDDKLILADRRDATEVLRSRRGSEASLDRIFFIEPHADDLLQVLLGDSLPTEVVVLSNLARAEQTLRRIRILMGLEGTEAVRPLLESVSTELERALEGRVSDIPDLEADFTLPRTGTLDLTVSDVVASGPRRVLTTSSGLRIRAFDGTELAVYDPDAARMFSKKFAKDLGEGDQVCVFGPDFVAAARERLNLTADAPEVLALYHKTVADAARNLPGRDMTAKTSMIRAKMLRIDPNLDLPTDQAIRHWLDVDRLAATPRDEVKPQAPRDRRHFLCFMKALNVSETVARNYWDFGIFWTRSIRIRTGSSFHQVFMSILVDPDGTASRLPAERRDEVWRIYETAEQHLLTIVGNKPETEA